MTKNSSLSKKGSILIAEDEEDIREIIKDALEGAGYKVVTAANGQEGLAQLAKNPDINMILLDLMMPVMNGWQFMEVLSKESVFKNIPVVVVTAFSDQAKLLNVQDVIQKPFEIETILRFVEKNCKGPKSGELPAHLN